MINSTPWSGGTDEEYETQHFGFGTQLFKIAVRQMVEQKIKTCVTEMQNFLQNALDLNDTDKVTLTQSCNKLIRLYCERANPSLEAIDDEIDKVLKVPSNALLPEDEVQAEELTDEEYKKLQEEVENLKKRVERGALMEALLTAEDNEYTTIEKTCELSKKEIDVFETLSKNVDELQCVKTIVDNTQSLCASVPFMADYEEYDQCEDSL